MVDGAAVLRILAVVTLFITLDTMNAVESAARGERMPNPLDDLREVVDAVNVPVQAVGGLSIEQAIRCPEYGAPLVVLGAPLTIDADAFKTASGDLESSLRMICQKVHAHGEMNQ